MFKNIWRWITGIIGDLARKLEKPASEAVKIVNVIRDYIDNPYVDVLTMLRRAGIDEKVITKLMDVFPSILATMLKTEGLIKSVAGWNGDVTALLRVLSEHLDKLSKEGKGKWWTELAALILQAITNEKIDKPVAIIATQGIYLKANSK